MVMGKFACVCSRCNKPYIAPNPSSCGLCYDCEKESMPKVPTFKMDAEELKEAVEELQRKIDEMKRRGGEGK